jgi:thiamine biosynthesis lipoprotein
VPPLTLARNAMNTRFEIVLHGGDPVRLRAVAEEALDEISRLDAQLSAYNRTSELTQINARAATAPVRVEPRLFRLLQHAQQLWRETGGTFDLTVAPLMRCWGFVRDTGRLPDPADLETARANVGMNLVELHEHNFTVRFTRPGVMLDPGAIGKGFALDVAMQTIRDAGIESALLHGGTSSVSALGAPPDAEAWKIAIEYPRLENGAPVSPVAARAATPATDANPLLAVVPLKNESLSVSAVWGKGFAAGGRFFGHVIDPRTGEPADTAWLAAVVSPSSTDAEAFSTGLLTLGGGGLDAITKLRPGMRALVLSRGAMPEEFQVAASGIAASSV